MLNRTQKILNIKKRTDRLNFVKLQHFCLSKASTFGERKGKTKSD